MKKRILLAVVVALLLVSCSVMGTLAWLQTQTESVTNTFTVGDINIVLDEHKWEGGALSDSVLLGAGNTNSYEFVPGDTLDKDPYVIVNANSEACYLFVQVEVSGNTNGAADPIIDWNPAADWTVVSGEAPGTVVLGRIMPEQGNTDSEKMPILLGDTVTVSEDVTKEMVSAINTTPPTLKFTAYAIQSKNLKSTGGTLISGTDAEKLAAAWTVVSAS